MGEGRGWLDERGGMSGVVNIMYVTCTQEELLFFLLLLFTLELKQGARERERERG